MLKMLRGKRLKGFTLVEVMASVVVVGVAMVAILSMFSFGNDVDATIENHVRAFHIAQNKIEELKGIEFADLAGKTYVHVDPSITNIAYTVDVNVSTDAGWPTSVQAYLKRVVVDVSWSEANTTVHEVIETVMANTDY